MTREEMLACLNDRPCSACKFHTDAGCGRWSCVFEEQPDDTKNKGDLISRQAVFDELEKWDWQDLYLPSHFKQILDDVPSVGNKGEWIPVSERLPDDHDWYVIVVKEKSTGYQYIPRIAMHHSGNRWAIIDTENADKEWLDDLECIAWMPLPSPYKADMRGE